MKKILPIAILAILFASCWTEVEVETVDIENSIQEETTETKVISDEIDPITEEEVLEKTEIEEDTESSDKIETSEELRETSIPDPEETDEIEEIDPITEEEILEDIDSLINDIINSEND